MVKTLAYKGYWK